MTLYRDRSTIWRLGFIGLIVLGASACSIGPKALKNSHPSYNEALHLIGNQELLLNIVRTRYAESVKFLQVSAINANFKMEQNLSVGTSLGVGDIQPTTPLNLNTELNYADNATISFRPLEGQAFATRLLNETPLSTLMVMVRGGWKIEPVMRILVQRIGRLYNYPEDPSYPQFLALVRLWSSIQDREDIGFVRLPRKPDIVAESVSPDGFVRGGLDTLHMLVPGKEGKLKIVRPNGLTTILMITYKDAAEADLTDAYLGKPVTRIKAPDGRPRHMIALMDGLDFFNPKRQPAPNVTKVNVLLRSHVNQLKYAAQGVDVPEDHQDMIQYRPDAQGSPFDPRPMVQDLIFIRMKEGPFAPSHALMSIRYRGYWFYIDDRDLASKNTFSLLSMIYSLQAEAASGGAIQTISVGGG